MLREDTFVRQLSRNLYQWNPVSNVRIINWQNINNIPGSEIKGLSLSTFFVFDKFLYKLKTHRSIEKVGEERGIVCSHRDA
jgi:hypothetical protein